MKPPRLFFKIFLWFWLTLIVSVVSVALTFVITSPTPAGQWHRPGAMREPGPPLRRPPARENHYWIAALVASSFVCYLLTLYLTRPIVRLRRAARELASGNLQSRALGTSRNDELGDLVRDFNVMASRIDEVVSRQRQLIYDMSHELRSPLARLNVALDLARERKGTDPSFDHMQHDIERLNEMIGRLLTIARLDAASTPLTMSEVDLSELVAQIVHDAGLEAGQRDVTVALSADPACCVVGSAEFLSSAIENVVRNAVHYTDPGTTVDVAVRTDERLGQVNLSVRDRGPGVPEAELTRIFLPFYRTTEARDRKSGGAGLGLAIADRVIRAHGGTIVATNVEPHGLEIRVVLPAGDRQANL